jgi:hypothetical protein
MRTKQLQDIQDPCLLHSLAKGEQNSFPRISQSLQGFHHLSNIKALQALPHLSIQAREGIRTEPPLPPRRPPEVQIEILHRKKGVCEGDRNSPLGPWASLENQPLGGIRVSLAYLPLHGKSKFKAEFYRTTGNSIQAYIRKILGTGHLKLHPML